MSLSFSNAYTSYTATSSLIYSIGFAYENQSEIKVRTKLSSGVYQDVTNWNFLGTTSIQFTSTPPATFEIYRATDITRSYGTPGFAKFRTGALLNAEDLNKNFELLRRGIEENNAIVSGLLFEDGEYFDEAYVNVDGDKMTGSLYLGTATANNIVLNTDGTAGFSKVTTDATLSTDNDYTLTTKGYVDDEIAAIPGTDLAYDSATRVVSSSTGTNATLSLVVAGGDSGLLTGADKTKLDGIETGATADQTDAEIKTAYENNADTNAFTDAEKTKLAGIAAGAQVNVGTDLTYYPSTRLLDSSTGTNATLPEVTAAGDSGFMTGADKTKLDGIAAGAQVNVATDLTYTASTRLLESSTGTDVTLPEVAAAGDSGFMTGADKTKLDGIQAGAQVNTVTSVNGQTGAVTINGTTDLTYTASTRLLESSTGTDVTLPEVVAAGDSGLMTGADKTKLDGISTGADVSPWTTSGATINYTTGNVGIGTSSPNNLLSIAGSSPRLEITDTDTSARFLIDCENSNGSVNFRVDQDNILADSSAIFTIDGSERARIDSSGYLLVGKSTSQLTSAVEVNGNMASGNYANNLYASGLRFYKSKSGTVSVHGLVSNDTQLGDLRFLGSDGTQFVQGVSIRAEVDGTPGANDMPGRLVFSTTADGASFPTERMRIDSAGNVGIGTTSPDSVLEVYRNSASTNHELRLKSTSPGLRLIDTSTPPPNGASDDAELVLNADKLTLGMSNEVNASTALTPRVAVSGSTGYVSIGTDSTNHKLYVYGMDNNNFNATDFVLDTGTTASGGFLSKKAKIRMKAHGTDPGGGATASQIEFRTTGHTSNSASLEIYASDFNGTLQQIFDVSEFSINHNGNSVLTSALYATQAEAEAGTNNTKVMTPLRVAQAIAALGGGGSVISSIQRFSGYVTAATTNVSISSVFMSKTMLSYLGNTSTLDNNIYTNVLIELTAFNTVQVRRPYLQPTYGTYYSFEVIEFA